MVSPGQRLWDKNPDMKLDTVELCLQKGRQRRRLLDRNRRPIKFGLEIVLMLRRHDPADPVVEGTFVYYWQQFVEDQGLVRGRHPPAWSCAVRTRCSAVNP